MKHQLHQRKTIVLIDTEAWLKIFDHLTC